MYKAGRRWLVAGISLLSGLLGGSTLVGTTAKAQTPAPGTGKTVEVDQITATQTSTTIPATSQSAALPSASVSQSLEGSQSLATSRETKTSATATEGTIATVTSTTSQASPAVAPATTSVTDKSSQATTSVTAQLRGAATAVSAPAAYALPFETIDQNRGEVNQTSYNKGTQAARDQIDGIVNKFDSTGANSITHLVGNLGFVGAISNQITANIQRISNLIDLYYQGKNFQYDDAYGTPVWYNGEATTPQTAHLIYHDFNLGYADYLRAFTRGISEWAAGIKAKALSSDPHVADGLINYGNYDGSQLTGGGLLGTASTTINVGLSWAQGIWKTPNYANNILSYQNSNNLAAESVSKTATAINYYISIVAPVVINGIAHQALADVRAIGGHIGDQDYAPAKLSDAVNLNGNMTKFLKGIGLSDVLGTTIVQNVYEAIRANAQNAIERNWTIGANKALKNFWNDTKPVDSESSYKDIQGYNEENPEAILNTTSSVKLSRIAEAAGYAWYQKIVSKVIRQAGYDAQNNQAQRPIDDVMTNIAQLFNGSNDPISTDLLNQILQGGQHVYPKTNTPYVRKSTGVRAVLTNIYQAAYKSIQGVLRDYQANPQATDADIERNQQRYQYTSLADGTQQPVNNYSIIYKFLRQLNSPYGGMMLADKQVLTEKTGSSKIIDDEQIGRKAYDFFYDTVVNILSGNPKGQQSDLNFLNVRTDYFVNDALLQKLATSQYRTAYQKELGLANQMFNAGMAFAQQHYQNSATGFIPQAEDAGVDANNNSARGDQSVKRYANLSAPYQGDLHSGDLFKAGYTAMLAPVIVKLEAANSADRTAFKTTSFTGQTLKGQDVSLEAPEPKAGWIATPPTQIQTLKAGQTTVTFQYKRATTLEQSGLAEQQVTFNGKDAQTLLKGTRFTPHWSDQTTGQTITIAPSWLTVDNNGTRTGDFTYHLNKVGAQQVYQQLQTQLTATAPKYALPDVGELTQILGTLHVAATSDSRLLPQLKTKPAVTVVGRPLDVQDLVVTATDSQGQPIELSHVTMGPVDWQQAGQQVVQLTLQAPTSQQSVTATTTVEVVTPEQSLTATTSTTDQQGSISQLESGENSVSDLAVSAMSQLANVSTSEVTLSQQSLSDDRQLTSLTDQATSLSSRVSQDQSLLGSRTSAVESRTAAGQTSLVSQALQSTSDNPVVDSATVSQVSLSEASLSSWSQAVQAAQKSAQDQLTTERSQSKALAETSQRSRSRAAQSLADSSTSTSRWASQIASEMSAGTSARTSLVAQEASEKSALASLTLTQANDQSTADNVASALAVTSDASLSLAQEPQPDPHLTTEISQSLSDLVTASQSISTQEQQLIRDSQQQAQVSVGNSQAHLKVSLSQGSLINASQSAAIASISDHSLALASQEQAAEQAENSVAMQSRTDRQTLASVSTAEHSLSQLFWADHSASVQSTIGVSLNDLSVSGRSLSELVRSLSARDSRLTFVATSLTAQVTAASNTLSPLKDAQRSLNKQITSQTQSGVKQTSALTSLAEQSLSAATAFDSIVTSLIEHSLALPNLPAKQRSQLAAQLQDLSQQAVARQQHWNLQVTQVAQKSLALVAEQQNSIKRVAQRQKELSQSVAQLARQSTQLKSQSASLSELLLQPSQDLNLSLANAKTQWVGYGQTSQALVTPNAKQTAQLTSAAASLSEQSVSVISQSVQVDLAQGSAASESLAARSAWLAGHDSLFSQQESSVSAETSVTKTQLTQLANGQQSLKQQAQTIANAEHALQHAVASASTLGSEITSQSVASVKQIETAQQQVAAHQVAMLQTEAANQTTLITTSQALAQHSQQKIHDWAAQTGPRQSLTQTLNSAEQLSVAQTSAQWSLINVSLSDRSVVDWLQQSTWVAVSQSLLATQTPIQRQQLHSAEASLSAVSLSNASERQQLKVQSESLEAGVTQAVATSQNSVDRFRNSQQSLAAQATAVQSQFTGIASQMTSLRVQSQIDAKDYQQKATSVAQQVAEVTAQQAKSQTKLAMAALASASTSLALQSLSVTSVSLSNQQSLISMTQVMQAGQSTLNSTADRYLSLQETSASQQSQADHRDLEQSQALQNGYDTTKEALTSVTTDVQQANHSLSVTIETALTSAAASVALVQAKQQAQHAADQQQVETMTDQQQLLTHAAQSQQAQTTVDTQQWATTHDAENSLVTALNSTAVQASNQATSQQSLIDQSLSARSEFTRSQQSEWLTVQHSLSQLPVVTVSQTSGLTSAQQSLSQQEQGDLAAQDWVIVHQASLAVTAERDLLASQSLATRQRHTNQVLSQVDAELADHLASANKQVTIQAEQSTSAMQQFQTAVKSADQQVIDVGHFQQQVHQMQTDHHVQSLALTSAEASLSLLSVAETSVSLTQDHAWVSLTAGSQAQQSQYVRSLVSLASLAEASAQERSIWRQAQLSALTSAQQSLRTSSQAMQSVGQGLSQAKASLSLVASQTISAATSQSISARVGSELIVASTAEASLQHQVSVALQQQSAVTSLQTSLRVQDSRLQSEAAQQSHRVMVSLASQSALVSEQLVGQPHHSGWQSAATSLSDQLGSMVNEMSQSVQTSQRNQSLSQKSTAQTSQLAASRSQLQAALTSQSQSIVTSLAAKTSQLVTTEHSLLASLGTTLSQLSEASTASVSLQLAHRPVTVDQQAQVTSLLDQAVAETSTLMGNSAAQRSLAQRSVAEALASLSVRSQRDASLWTSLATVAQSETQRSQTLNSVAELVSTATGSVSVASQQEQSIMTSRSDASLVQDQLPTEAESTTAATAVTTSDSWRPEETAASIEPQVTGKVNQLVTQSSGSKHHHLLADHPRFKRFRITGVKKLGLYLSPDFSRRTRLTWYAQRSRTHQPMFEVLGHGISKHGTLRYKVRDINRQSATYGLVGYVTTRLAYVRPTYYARLKHTSVITVLNAHGINGYRTVKFTGRLQHYRPGQSLRIKRWVHHGQTTRYQLTNGQYVTANKQWVIRGRVQRTQRLALTHQVLRTNRLSADDQPTTFTEHVTVRPFNVKTTDHQWRHGRLKLTQPAAAKLGHLTNWWAFRSDIRR